MKVYTANHVHHRHHPGGIKNMHMEVTWFSFSFMYFLIRFFSKHLLCISNMPMAPAEFQGYEDK